MATYATAPKSYATGPKEYANALRSYASGPTSGANAPAQVMAPHLSQPIPIDQDIVAAYKQFMTDPQAKQYEQYGADLERVWRTSPTASIFKPGYQHNQYVLDRAAALRAARQPQPTTTSDPSQMYIRDEEGNRIRNPAYVGRENDSGD